MFWFSKEDAQPWLQIERRSSKGLTLDSFLYSAPLRKLRKNTDNPFVENTIALWHEVHKYLGDLPVLSCFSPIWGNGHFSPAKSDMGFKAWLSKGINKILDLYKDNILMSFDELKAKYDVPQKHFFKYLQLRSFILTCLKNSVQQPPISTLEMFSPKICSSKGLVTQLYNIMVENHKDDSESKRQQWIGDLQEDISVEDWGIICSKVHTQTINTRLRLIQYISQITSSPVPLNPKL